jgi:hypothetical protein
VTITLRLKSSETTGMTMKVILSLPKMDSLIILKKPLLMRKNMQDSGKLDIREAITPKFIRKAKAAS